MHICAHFDYRRIVEILGRGCSNGHCEFVDWLTDFRPSIIYSMGIYIWESTRKQGHSQIIQILFSKIDIRWGDDHILKTTIQYGYGDLAEMISDNYPFYVLKYNLDGKVNSYKVKLGINIKPVKR